MPYFPPVICALIASFFAALPLFFAFFSAYFLHEDHAAGHVALYGPMPTTRSGREEAGFAHLRRYLFSASLRRQWEEQDQVFLYEKIIHC